MSSHLYSDLQNVEIILLDIGALKAGASVTGEFENRLKSVIKEVNQSEKPIIWRRQQTR